MRVERRDKEVSVLRRHLRPSDMEGFHITVHQHWNLEHVILWREGPVSTALHKYDGRRFGCIIRRLPVGEGTGLGHGVEVTYLD